MIHIDEDVIKRLKQTIMLLWRTRIRSKLGIYSKLIRVNIELALFATRSQCYSRTQNSQYTKLSEQKQMMVIVEMNIFSTQTMVEFVPLKIKIKTFKWRIFSKDK